MGRPYDQNCPMARTLEVVGDRWTMLIVRELLKFGDRRFADFEIALRGIAPNVLSERLRALEDAGLVRREIYSDRPLRASYRLTDMGLDLGYIAGALSHFGSKHLMPDSRLTHGDSGHLVSLRYFCAECGGFVRGAEVFPEVAGSVPGPIFAERARRAASAPPTP
ncbi:MAG: winged helix-turn-helix transcriptional regulator [Tepidiformaceae bacterium]